MHFSNLFHKQLPKVCTGKLKIWFFFTILLFKIWIKVWIKQQLGWTFMVAYHLFCIYWLSISSNTGVDPKSVLCAFFKQGQCTKGDKCKFSHDLTIERRGEKRNIYEDKKGLLFCFLINASWKFEHTKKLFQYKRLS